MFQGNFELMSPSHSVARHCSLILRHLNGRKQRGRMTEGHRLSDRSFMQTESTGFNSRARQAQENWKLVTIYKAAVKDWLRAL